MTPDSITHDIERLLDDLDALTEEYGRVAEEAAIAESDYKRRVHRALVVLAERGTKADGSKSTADWRTSQAAVSAEDEERHYRILEARQRALREALTTKRARLDAYRTFAANVRAQT